VQPRTRRRRNRQRGQVLGLAALLLPVMLAFAVLAVDTGYNWADRRALQSAADQAALAGASTVSSGTSTMLQTAQAYAWRGVRQSVPAAVASGCTSSVTTCTVGPVNGYTVTVTANYQSQDHGYSASNTVAVDVQHDNPGLGFEAWFGVTKVRIKVHAAATSAPGTVNFPFALATRFLNLTGSSTVAAYGAVLVGQCSDNGRGDFVSNGANGGILIGGSSEIDLGQAKDSNNNNSSAQALLLGTPGTQQCSNAPNTASDGSSGWGTFGNNVSFDQAGSLYNYYYGFDSGPTGCSSSTSTNPQSTCTASSIGGTAWQDGCWTSGNQTVPIKTTSAAYTASTSGVGSISSGTVSPCSAASSHEGSFPMSTSDNRWPNLPVYSAPADIAANLTGSAISTTNPGNGSSTLAAGAGGTTYVAANQYFSATSVNTRANLVFAPGYYVFDGSGASLNIGNGSSGSFTCASGASSHITNFPGYSGCVFVFENGASLSMQSGAMNCASGSTYNGTSTGDCAFEFDGNGSLSFSSGLNASMHPIPYTDSTSGVTYRMPLIYSTQNLNCLSNTSGTTSGSCAISMSSSGATFDVRGTIYARYGIVSINANASPVSGQVIADTVLLQAGSSAAPGGVAYNGSAVAPAAAPANLIE